MGQRYRRQLPAHANLILLLSQRRTFLASDYCYETEVKAALYRYAKGDAEVVPVILRACDWGAAPFGELQGLPKDGRPLSSWENRDEAWNDVAKGIRKVIERLQQHR